MAKQTWQQNHNAFTAFMREASPVAFLVNQEMQRGKKFADALDFICGEGSFARLAKEIYDGIRAKATA